MNQENSRSSAPLSLVVEDSRTMRTIIAFTLKEKGFDVIEAEDGKHALQVLENQKVQIVITDLNMPHMNGFELIRHLRKLDLYKNTPILILTTENADEKKQEGKQAGASGWLVKPFDPAKLINAVQKVCTAIK